MPAGGHDELPTSLAHAIGHGGRLTACGQVAPPQLLVGFYVEGTEVVVECHADMQLGTSVCI